MNVLKKDDRRALVVFLAPAVFIFVLIYIYPTIRTFIMSFHDMPSLTGSVSTWTFVGLDKYLALIDSQMFVQSLANIFKIWIYGGIFTLLMAMLLAVIVTAGVKFKGFFKSVIYLPNVIAAVALGTMWLQYIYNARFGFLHNLFTALGLEKLATIQWTSMEHIFGAMVFAYSFGMIGYFMLMYAAGIDDIPEDFFEAASLEGAGKVRQFFFISLPTLRPVIKSSIILWSVRVVGFFVWSQVFSPLTPEMQTVTPMIYMYQVVFGSDVNASYSDPGLGAAIGVVLTLLVILAYGVVNLLFRDKD